MSGSSNSNSGTNQMAVPQAKEAMNRFKQEVASEIGVPSVSYTHLHTLRVPASDIHTHTKSRCRPYTLQTEYFLKMPGNGVMYLTSKTNGTPVPSTLPEARCV